MGLFTSENYESLRELFLKELAEVNWAEHAISEVLQKMADKTASEQLADAFRNHAKESEIHKTRIEEIFQLLDETARQGKGEGCKGLLKEAHEMLDATGAREVIDAGMIIAAQRLEHYEIAQYGALKALAARLGQMEVVDNLEDTLEEEKEADLTLSSIAEIEVNQAAAKIVVNEL